MGKAHKKLYNSSLKLWKKMKFIVGDCTTQNKKKVGQLYIYVPSIAIHVICLER